MTMRDPRRQQLARIHMGKKALQLDDATYRSLLQRITGLTSSADMTPAQRNDVLKEMTRLGFKEQAQTAKKRGFPGRPKETEKVPMLRKVEALLADSKRPWSYAHAIAKRMFHVNRVEWLHDDQLHTLVAALQADANRKGKARA